MASLWIFSLPSVMAESMRLLPMTSRMAASAALRTRLVGSLMLNRYLTASLILYCTLNWTLTMFSSPVSMEASLGTLRSSPWRKVVACPVERKPTSQRSTWVTCGL